VVRVSLPLREFDPRPGGDIDRVLVAGGPARWRVSDSCGDLLAGAGQDHWLYLAADRVLALALLCPEHELVLPTGDTAVLNAWLLEARHDGDTGYTDAVMADYASDRGFRYLADADMGLVNARTSPAHERLRCRGPRWYPPRNFLVEFPPGTRPRHPRDIPELGPMPGMFAPGD